MGAGMCDHYLKSMALDITAKVWCLWIQSAGSIHSWHKVGLFLHINTSGTLDYLL